MQIVKGKHFFLQDNQAKGQDLLEDHRPSINQEFNFQQHVTPTTPGNITHMYVLMFSDPCVLFYLSLIFI